MKVETPSLQELKKIAEAYHLQLSQEELKSYQAYIESSLVSYERVAQLVEPPPPLQHERSGGYQPMSEDNPHRAWAYKVSIKGREDGVLAGKKIAIKDNISVAGIPMLNGSKMLNGYVPNEDATIVRRILDAGGEIVGKTVCEDLCFSGGSHTAASGPVLNPHNPAHMSGGSSSGSAVVVATGEVDIAIGGDQGGSVRIPSSWCGIVGLKPTFGLIPYTGAFPIELTLDHLGPIAKRVEDVALMLDVLAGEDGLDPRQSGTPNKSYSDALLGHTNGIKIGVVLEGFGWEGISEEDVDDIVRKAAYSFTSCGSDVEDVSIPIHRDGIHIWSAVAAEGATSLMIRGNGMGTNWKGQYSTGVMKSYGENRVANGNDFPDTVKKVLLQGTYMQEKYHGTYYGMAQNVSRKLKKAYDDALQNYDVLIMPTMLQKATKFPSPNAPREEVFDRAWETLYNAAPFNITGHPAISVPCGSSGGLPIGMMIIGRCGEDDTVLQVAYAFQMLQN
jgi:amidase